MRGDAPALNSDSMRILVSLAFKHKWSNKKIELELAYLQPKGFSCDLYVRLPPEDGETNGYWKLLGPPVGLPESRGLWYLLSYEALTKTLASTVRARSFFIFPQAWQRVIDTGGSGRQLPVRRDAEPVRPIRITPANTAPHRSSRSK